MQFQSQSERVSSVRKVMQYMLKKNHFSSVCKSREVTTLSTHDDYDFSNNAEFDIGSLDTNNKVTFLNEISYPWIERIRINEMEVGFKIDTGAQIDVIPLSVYKRMRRTTELRDTSIALKAFGGQTVHPKGMCSLICKFANMMEKITFAVVDFDFMPILGLKTCSRFGIIERPVIKFNKEL